MKKILTFIMVFALIMSMSVTAFAAGTEGNETITNEKNGVVSETLTDDKAEIDAWGLYDSDGDGVGEGEDEDDSTDVIAVDLSWDAMNWVYSAGSYDPDTMTDVAAQWIDADKAITVKNRSNVGITAAPTYSATVENTELAFDTQTLSLNAATKGTDGNNGTAAEGTITVSLGDNHTAAIGADIQIGTITVTIAKVGA